MTQSFMSPLSPFTLESLVTQGQWSAAQAQSAKRKPAAKTSNNRPSTRPLVAKDTKPGL
jgi:hypothetical protein